VLLWRGKLNNYAFINECIDMVIGNRENRKKKLEEVMMYFVPLLTSLDYFI